MKQLMILIFAWLSACAAVAAQPPPPPGRIELVADFFSAAPTSLPSSDVRNWARYISPDVEIYHGDTLAFTSRDEWLKDLNSPRGLGGQRISYSVGYLQFYELNDGGIRVLQWARPYDEGTVFHGVEPYQFVTYYFDESRLVRAVYDQRMTTYDLRSGKRWN